ncbi:MAG: SAM-dependent methyltransferase, partial [Alphaproteobacteria bacterium]|nr:SAM-dependent methyltransferase [Alphaproteobacteria bacterium]
MEGPPRPVNLAAVELTQVDLDAGLYLVATPIGNLRDVTLRALEVLASVDAIACEDTRTSRTLLDRYGIARPLVPYHDHNAAEMRPRLIARLEAGGRIALISDAGTPLVSDPGYKLVEAAIE